MTQINSRLSNRQIFLAAIVVGLIGVVMKLGLDPKAANRKPSNFSFPQSVPIPRWQLSSSKAIAPENPKLEEFFLDIHEYEYSQVTQPPLKIGMYYTLGTRGESSVFLTKRLKIESGPIPIVQDFKGNAETGYYSMYNYKGRSHLLSCINPQGTSTATSQQFLANRSKYDFQPERFMPWLLGQESLRDMRCLWVEMSMPVEPEIAYPILEKTWVGWYQYWQNKFPTY